MKKIILKGIKVTSVKKKKKLYLQKKSKAIIKLLQ